MKSPNIVNIAMFIYIIGRLCVSDYICLFFREIERRDAEAYRY